MRFKGDSYWNKARGRGRVPVVIEPILLTKCVSVHSAFTFDDTYVYAVTGDAFTSGNNVLDVYNKTTFAHVESRTLTSPPLTTLAKSDMATDGTYLYIRVEQRVYVYEKDGTHVDDFNVSSTAGENNGLTYISPYLYYTYPLAPFASDKLARINTDGTNSTLLSAMQVGRMTTDGTSIYNKNNVDNTIIVNTTGTQIGTFTLPPTPLLYPYYINIEYTEPNYMIALVYGAPDMYFYKVPYS